MVLLCLAVLALPLPQVRPFSLCLAAVNLVLPCLAELSLPLVHLEWLCLASLALPLPLPPVRVRPFSLCLGAVLLPLVPVRLVLSLRAELLPGIRLPRRCLSRLQSTVHVQVFLAGPVESLRVGLLSVVSRPRAVMRRPRLVSVSAIATATATVARLSLQ
jgi:hypothetical protein